MKIDTEHSNGNPFYEGLITKDTLAVLPVYHEWYQARIIDRFKADVYLTETPSKVIDLACLYWMSSPSAMRRSINVLLNCHKKLPVAIQPELNIFACPTASPEQFGCMWIFPWHIADKGGDKSSSYVIFHNGTRIDLPVSFYVLQKQIQRTCEIMVRYMSSINER
ncbi:MULTISPECIES: competence protein ComK [Pontibacillus]|uniref:Competence protein ComK n=1 Tax=Pontibacillus chungwhensis TaxID=265426 RepID=A0ABY8UXA0_9BACI|nr:MULTISPECIES: competence protein ComK [Pontibacillus]MCD5324115.1 competence protein ComK [Pontibacillus sp. HN14]WIF97828.1 competence protein ComK [Pontibacillus chungwhensis]